ncbi:hypothetical protein TIFTF001_034088 [Ficus carica]|uniref:Uncharacterized protein n=1 Tax=Ficus carica TaxID=3494 RepID=A0AA88E348_FICCA|nr:hypothetical protein TIFTF001_034088 [Ficus carica]
MSYHQKEKEPEPKAKPGGNLRFWGLIALISRWSLSPGSGDERQATGEFDIEAGEVLRPSENKRIVPLSREKPEYTAKSQLQMDLLMPNQPSPFKNSVYYVGESSSSSLLPSELSFSTSQSTSSSRQSSFSHSSKPLSPLPPPLISNERGLSKKYPQQMSQSSKVTAVRKDSRRSSLKKFLKTFGHTFKKILDKQEIPKHAVTWVIPIGALILSIYLKDRESIGLFIQVVALLVVVGLSMLFTGFLTQEECESFGFGSTLLGYAFILGAFSFLFAYLLWPHNVLLASIPIICWIFIALLLFMGFINRESAPSPQNSGSDKVKTDTHKNIPGLAIVSSGARGRQQCQVVCRTLNPRWRSELQSSGHREKSGSKGIFDEVDGGLGVIATSESRSLHRIKDGRERILWRVNAISGGLVERPGIGNLQHN